MNKKKQLHTLGIKWASYINGQFKNKKIAKN